MDMLIIMFILTYTLQENLYCSAKGLRHHPPLPDFEAAHAPPPIKKTDTSHPCQRPCVKGQPPMTCNYIFNIQWYQTMSKACYNCPFTKEDCFRPHCVTGDGIKKLVITINRQTPGPIIDVCQGDYVVVDVKNHLTSESTSIHWHGQEQKRNPYMDGVPFLTQCPVLPNALFRYEFYADEAGTHFYHSHSAGQRGDGAYGAFIVRSPPQNYPNSHLYDFDLPHEHTMLLMDNSKYTSTEKFMHRYHDDGDINPTSLLINGRGVYANFSHGENEEVVHLPRSKFLVQEGKKYRFRVISNGFLNCPIEVSVDHHNITIISVDGNPIQPVIATSFVIYAGERYDFVLHARPQGERLWRYWIRFKGHLFCGEDWTRVHHEAVLQYADSWDTSDPADPVGYEHAHRDGLQVGPVDQDGGRPGFLTISELNSTKPWDRSLQTEPDVRVYIKHDFALVDNPSYHYPGLYGINDVTNKDQVVNMPLINSISFKFPPFPLMPQRDMIEEGLLCNRSTVDQEECSKTKFCICTHVIKLPLNAVVELVIVDEGFGSSITSHPMHLHGYIFRVVAMGKLGVTVSEENVRKLDKLGIIKRNLVNPPQKDTLAVPTGGYGIIRFVSNNPGFWLYHCHLDFHVETGMGLIFQVGAFEDMMPVPLNFPRCGNYPDDMTRNTKNHSNYISELFFAIKNFFANLLT